MTEPTGPGSPTGPGLFAVRLRRLREAAALTQEELAARAGLTVKAVGALERGERRRPYPHTVRALAEALQLDESARTAFVAAVRQSGEERTTEPPAPPDRFPAEKLLGRERELRDVVTRLRAPGTRLLTITGPGGVGKTRLAVSAASAVAADFPDGVAVVELAAVREVALVLPTIGRVLGLTQVKPSDGLEAVAAFVGRRRQLIVLDNLEHLLAAAPDLAVLLGRCPGLVVLATSRAPLRLRSEQDYPLGPLALPRTGDVAAVAASPAAQVFLGRARAVDPALELSTATAPAVAAICARLDGLPLALELAAAHARLLPPWALLDRLSSALSLVRSRDRPERHRTMTATLDWSHDLLTRDEQRLLRRLSIFAGGFSLAAAEQVAGHDGAVFPVLAGLVEQSLVTPEIGNEARYRMLEPVREYAWERLRAAGEVEQHRDRHADYFCSLGRAGRARAAHRDPGGMAGSPGAGPQQPTGSAGHTAGAGRPEPDGAAGRRHLAVLGAARPRREARAWLEDLVGGSSPNGMPAADRAAAHLGLAGLRYAVGDITGLCGRHGRCRDLPRGPGRRAAGRGAAAAGRGCGLPERPGCRRCSAGRRRHPPRRSAIPTLAQARFAQGQLEFQAGNLDRSTVVLAEAETIARRAGLPFTLGVVLNMQAMVAELTGADDVALDHLGEAAEAEVGTTWTLVYTLPALGVLPPTGLSTAAWRCPSRPSEGADHWLATVRRELGGVGPGRDDRAPCRSSWPTWPPRSADDFVM